MYVRLGARPVGSPPAIVRTMAAVTGCAWEAIAYAATFNFAAPVDRRGDRITADGKTLRFSDVDFNQLRSNPASVGEISLLNEECTEIEGSKAISGLTVLQGYIFDLDKDGELEESEKKDYILVAHQKGGVLIYDVTDRENIEWLLAHNEGPIKYFVGYAGWTGGPVPGRATHLPRPCPLGSHPTAPVAKRAWVNAWLNNV